MNNTLTYGVLYNVFRLAHHCHVLLYITYYNPLSILFTVEHSHTSLIKFTYSTSNGQSNFPLLSFCNTYY